MAKALYGSQKPAICTRKNEDRLMNVKSILSRLRSGDVHYVFGRFRAFRISYSRIRRFRETGFRVSPEISSRQTLFPDIDVDQAVKTIRDDAVFLGIRLPATIVREIDTFCRSTPLFARHDPDGPTFFHHDVIRGHTPDGRPTPTGSIRDPMSCGAVRATTSAASTSSMRAFTFSIPTNIPAHT